ncbi:eukaryotic and archaeal DNA primase, large subunit-domain-containing protein [Lipomyces oligophaga]|uniref:eukaryotic and archaeal DNA primase, large subunit-domain-containing protein n=1 Tax=Lipomyces oligophaga TaxID=45792 RepID=UPI0034CDA368
MFRAQKKRTLERTNFGLEVHRDQAYPDRLNFYSVPPNAEITIEEFENWAVDRLRVLSEIEGCLVRNRTGKQLEQVVRPSMEKYIPLSRSTSGSGTAISGGKVDTDYERKKDYYSHYILRLAFCKSEELRRRFVKAESILFRLRYTASDISEQQSLLSRYDFGWVLVSEEEKTELQDFLVFASESGSPSVMNPTAETFYKVPFERVPELIESRRVFVKSGDAYVPSGLQVNLIVSEFGDRLGRALDLTARALPRLDEDDRLVPVLDHLAKGFVEPEYNPESTSSISGTITAVQVDGLVNHYPLCMRTMQKALLRDHHLKYFGRQQYGLFLKGIGLNVEEALTFWRSHFKHSPDQFNKDYRYNIRHNYGLEGARKNYRPMSCVQIINDAAPGPGDSHGCPFRTFSEDHLAGALSEIGINDSTTLRLIKDDIRTKQFHVACTRVFEQTHKSAGAKSTIGTAVGQESITHPNLYFDRSMQFTSQVINIETASAPAS